MLYETEKTVLALAITYPDLMEILIHERRPGMFAHPEAVKTFDLILEIKGDERAVDWDRLIDRGAGVISGSYFVAIQDKQLLVIPKHGLREYFVEKVMELKRDVVKKELGKIIERPTLSETEHREILSVLDGIEHKSDTEPSDISIALDEYSEWKSREHTGISLGFPTIDNHTGDFSPGEVVAIMARTFVGKTFVALNSLHSMRAKFSQVKMGMFSMEMSKAPLAERMMQINSNVSRHDIEDDHQDSLSTAYQGLHIYSKVYSVAEIGETVKRDKLSVIFIDHLQLVKGQGSSLYEKTTRIMQDLKTLAKEYGIVLFILVQLSRKAGEGKDAVTLDMARDSGAIEEHSDFILALWNLEREVKGELVSKDSRAMRLLKNKRGSTIGIKVHFNPDTGRMIEQMPEIG